MSFRFSESSKKILKFYKCNVNKLKENLEEFQRFGRQKLNLHSLKFAFDDKKE